MCASLQIELGMLGMDGPTGNHHHGGLPCQKNDLSVTLATVALLADGYTNNSIIIITNTIVKKVT